MSSLSRGFCLFDIDMPIGSLLFNLVLQCFFMLQLLSFILHGASSVNLCRKIFSASLSRCLHNFHCPDADLLDPAKLSLAQSCFFVPVFLCMIGFFTSLRVCLLPRFI